LAPNYHKGQKELYPAFRGVELHLFVNGNSFLFFIDVLTLLPLRNLEK
jgi:hypothetical protein